MKKSYMLLLLLLSMAAMCRGYSFGQNKVNTTPQDFSVIKTMHFDIYFPKGEDQFGKTVSLMAEDIYYYIKSEFNVPILSRIPIVFYGTKSEFQTTNIIYPLLTEGVGGFTESLKNRVVVPFDGSYAALEELLAHELTHAYINAMDSSFMNTFTSLRPSAFPFWFSEGLPEYLSIGGEDDYNNMFILDMVINDSIVKLQQVDGYLAYRLGESFLTYIAEVWGREKVPEYFFAIRSSNNLDDATKKVFGMDFEVLESRWNYQLKRDFYPLVNSYGIPGESFEQRTKHKKDGSYFNFSPRFSPDASRYVYYSNSGARYSIWMAGAQGLAKPELVLRGEKSAKTEEFYYMRSTLSWFPDNRRVAFSAKTANGDRIHILDVDKGKIVKTYGFKELSAIYEVDVSPDGKQLVMSAQSRLQADLYLYDLESKQLTRLTNDSYNDANPRFSPDGSRVAFDSERRMTMENPRYGLFADITKDIYMIDLSTQEVTQLTSENYNCQKPIWADSGQKLVFVSYQDGIAEFEALELDSLKRAKLANTMAGVFSGDLSNNDEYLIMSNYFNGAWDIYFNDSPLANLQYSEPTATAFSSERADLLAGVDLSRLDYYGKQSRAERKRTNPGRVQDLRRPIYTDYEYSQEDSLRLFADYAWDDKPDSISTIPQVEKYKTRFSLNHLWGGMAYSSSSGTVGNLELGLGDMMGNHGIGISLGVSGKLEETNVLLSYLYLKNRTDYGVGVYNFFDDYVYRDYPDPTYVYKRIRQRETGGYFMLRYPISRFLRLEFDNQLYSVELNLDGITPENIEDEHWTNNLATWTDFVYAPGLSLVHDNSLSGSTGPLVGWRGYYTIRKSFARHDLDYLTNYIDLRSYSYFNKRYSFAMRFNGGISTGKNPDTFDLDGYYGVRGLEEELSGEKKLLTSAELRFPFLDYLALAFPVPLAFGNIRGSIFADAGSVWNEKDKFRGVRDGKLEGIKLSYGFGPRLNLGYFVLKLDVSWLTNLSRISKPLYYLSLTEDF